MQPGIRILSSGSVALPYGPFVAGRETPGPLVASPRCASPASSRPKDREFFDLFEEAGGNILRAAELLDEMLRELPRAQRARPRDPDLRAGGRPDHARHHPAPQPDVRHADRPRGHLRARLGARRHRRLHRGGRRLPRPLQDRGADGAGAASSPTCCTSAAARSPRRCRGCAASRTSPTTPSRSTGSRTTATGSSARRSRRCSTTGSTRWW